MERSLIVASIVVLCVIGICIGIFALIQDSPSASKDSAGISSNAQDTTANLPNEPTNDRYVPLADFETNRATYQNIKIVYFFTKASCSTCQVASSNILREETRIPQPFVIVNVDMEINPQLAQQYNVSKPHTFVQVDDGGKEMTRWDLSLSIQEILTNVQ